jgi:endonuclease/exonuclease/phosphatase (EEP) superfamily protein YafD
MKYLQKVLGFFSKCLAVGTILVVILTHLVFFDSWILSFLMIGLPVAVLLNFFAVVFWAILDPQRARLPLLACVSFLTLITRTYQFDSDTAHSQEVKLSNEFKVLNYNVSGFATLKFGSEKREERAKMLQWIIDSKADILCMPEYYSENAKFDSNKMLRDGGGYKYHIFTSNSEYKQNKSVWGLGVFSKHPIVFAKDTVFTMQNGLLLTDVKIKNDTVRVIAVHLHSMTLSLYTLRNQRELSGFKREGLDTFRRMRDGFVKRGKQFEVLAEWIRDSPYPVVVCGDFNETPYGYVYGNTRALLRNAFEVGGSGFGYTFNKLPYYIRIDHQFFQDSRLKLLDFKTDQSVKYSDHYPLMGTYSIQKPNATTN